MVQALKQVLVTIATIAAYSLQRASNGDHLLLAAHPELLLLLIICEETRF